ncbi:MAG TPA: UPF0175 family protein [Thermomicrobiaceae bacterium]|nr:UPF0175 family protein [Thermomicrobiaceae bacterium]
MTKTVSIAELAHGGAPRAIRESQREPVLVSKENHPAAWIVSAGQLAATAAALGDEAAALYRRALALVACDHYRQGFLTLGQATKLAGLSLSDFIDLCGRLQVPILWSAGEGLEADVLAAEAIADDCQPGA